MASSPHDLFDFKKVDPKKFHPTPKKILTFGKNFQHPLPPTHIMPNPSATFTPPQLPKLCKKILRFFLIFLKFLKFFLKKFPKFFKFFLKFFYKKTEFFFDPSPNTKKFPTARCPPHIVPLQVAAESFAGYGKRLSGYGKSPSQSGRSWHRSVKSLSRFGKSWHRSVKMFAGFGKSWHKFVKIFHTFFTLLSQF